ncbi:Heavy metal transport/detoxification protein [Xylanimonas cellulosilytica DSM 15894]|uniref:Heavy metal transport/detoxification protein n=1 Tax=Xylanimonas cellulosilytica (strain DSM 15894 / JCM 12276 / CECT 5975 / KCTC 9989 / LMG 20990 / NBRC 107835 / XIL07) TaxID=446471 RepID=D1C0Q5_XYLCX|nr:heavy-metal-associated domain-containing protein [Xylanimonas cellulosilytica]ACZ32258.1 Heavy metal transport/detoxification protein [Xylanimonas cellulosilytica DSM 15894]
MTTLTTLSVTGMTCEHCVAAVSRELKAVDGVKRVSVELRNGGTSSVSVHSGAPLDEAALREAIDEAGYDVVGIDVLEDALTAQMTERADAYRATGVRTVDDAAAPAAAAEVAAPDATPEAAPEAEAPEAAAERQHGGCACGCGGHGRQGLGIGLPIVPLN